MGLGSGAGLTSGSQNVFLGVNAGATNSTNNSNVYIGFECGGVNDGDDNVALGAEAMTGSLNQNCVFLGRLSGAHAINNNGSIYIGKDAGRENDHVTNVMIGYESGYGSTRSNENVFLGTKTGRSLKTGGANTLIGDHAGFSMSANETNNTFVGHQSGSAFDSGDNNTALGGSTVVNPGVNNSTAIGFNSTVCSSSTIVIGSNSAGAGNEFVVIGGCQKQFAVSPGELEVIGRDIWANGTMTPSDYRLKKNIKPIDNAIEKVSKLTGYTFNYKSKDQLGFSISESEQAGIIAQELIDNFEQPLRKSGNGYYGVNYSQLIPLLIQAIKEQTVKIEILEKEIKGSKEKESPNEELKDLNPTPTGRLYQNVPNPFEGETEIGYEISSDYTNAYLQVFDLNGQLRITTPLGKDKKGKVIISVRDLQPGIYAYSLIVDNALLESKTMVISK
jgi:hypothetical protein